MAKYKKISLEEAQNLYAKNKDVLEFLKSNFSEDELTAASPQKKETLEQKFKRVWEGVILTQCDHIVFINDKRVPTNTPTSRIRVSNSEGEWLFDYDYSPQKKNFWYSHQRVHSFLEKEVSSDVLVLQGLIESWVEDNLGLQGITPTPAPGCLYAWVEDNLGLQGITPLSTRWFLLALM